MVGYIPVQVRESSYSCPIAGASIQHDADSPISVMARYIPALLVEYIPAQGSGRWNMWLWRRGTEEQRAISVKKEGVDIWRSTDGQTLKSKELIFDEVRRGKAQKRKELIFEKYRQPNPKKEGVDLWQRHRRTISANKERNYACNLSR